MIGSLELEGVFEARDQTRKYLFRLADGEYIETVLIPSASRQTVCLSTQVGCKFGCAFCASGKRGFVRDLSPSEIVGPVLFLRDILDIALTNIVFMGMGEPLDNPDNLEKAVRILNAPEGLGLAARRMTVSTSGLVPGLERLAAWGLPINLSGWYSTARFIIIGNSGTGLNTRAIAFNPRVIPRSCSISTRNMGRP